MNDNINLKNLQKKNFSELYPQESIFLFKQYFPNLDSNLHIGNYWKSIVILDLFGHKISTEHITKEYHIDKDLWGKDSVGPVG